MGSRYEVRDGFGNLVSVVTRPVSSEWEAAGLDDVGGISGATEGDALLNWIKASRGAATQAGR